MTSQQYINWQGRMLGRYQLLQVVGRGGMGEVWLADDTQLRRHVAIKLLPAVLASDKNYLQDFIYEARALAVLEHPHILPVHDFGEQMVGDEVMTYLVMPYITGGSLRDRIHNVAGPLPTEEALYILREAAEAIDYAHSQRVLHRDIKPGNMLLQNGWLLLADFGLAKLLSSATHRSHTHAGAGTPEYMAPEQAQGKADAASDRYSLAIIAYQVFTGRLPFRGETPYETLIQHMRNTPPLPRQLNPNIPKLVEDTLMQGLAKRPEDRPTSCLTFANALEHGWNISQQLQAADPEAPVLAPWSKRAQQDALDHLKRPILSVPLLTPLPTENTERSVSTETVREAIPESPTPAYMPTVASVPSLPKTIAVEQDKIAETPIPEQQEGRRVGRRALLIGGATAVAAAVIASGFALPALLHHPSSVAKPPLVPEPKHLIPGVPILNLTGHTDEVWDVVWDPTGRYVATAGKDTRVMLWDIGSALRKSANSFQTISAPSNSWKFASTIYNNNLCWSVDGRTLLVTLFEPDISHKIHFIDAFSQNKTSIYTNIDENSNTTNGYHDITWRPNTTEFAASVITQPSSVKVDMWEVGHTQHISKSFTYNAAEGVEAEELAWSLNGSMLAGNLNDFKVVVWEAKTGNVLRAIQMPSRTNIQYVHILRGAIAWSPVDSNVLLASDIDVCVVLNVKQNKILHILGTDNIEALIPPKQNPDNWIPNVHGLAWSPNGRYIVGGYGRTSKICLWDLQNKTPTVKNGVQIQDAFIPASSSVGGQNGVAIDLAWSPDGRYLASASADKTVLIWKMDAS